MGQNLLIAPIPGAIFLDKLSVCLPPQIFIIKYSKRFYRGNFLYGLCMAM